MGHNCPKLCDITGAFMCPPIAGMAFVNRDLVLFCTRNKQAMRAERIPCQCQKSVAPAHRQHPHLSSHKHSSTLDCGHGQPPVAPITASAKILAAACNCRSSRLTHCRVQWVLCCIASWPYWKIPAFPSTVFRV